jgi:hypothetical protein
MKPWTIGHFLPRAGQRRVVVWGLMGWVGVVAQTHAQAPALAELKKGYEEELVKTVLPLREGYRKALLSLEAQLAAKGDYAGARRVQEERREIDRLTGRTVAPPAVAVVGLVGPEGIGLGLNGEAAGGVQIKQGAWTGWGAAGASIRWSLPAGLRGGGYGVELQYETSGPGNLPLKICEDFHSLSRVAKIEAGSVAGDPPRKLRVGTLRLRPGATRLELKLTAPSTAPGFALTGLRLIPEDTAP